MHGGDDVVVGAVGEDAVGGFEDTAAGRDEDDFVAAAVTVEGGLVGGGAGAGAENVGVEGRGTRPVMGSPERARFGDRMWRWRSGWAGMGVRVRSLTNSEDYMRVGGREWYMMN